MKKKLKRPLVLSTVALAVLQISNAYGQSSNVAAADVKKDSTLNLETVVVTGTSTATSKMKSSVSVSSIDGDQMIANQPQNASDVLSAIPGLFVQSSGGGGNANVSVRGLPISGGGSRYVQFQEDGLLLTLIEN